MQLPAKLINSFIQRTNYAITTEQSRFTLSGAKFIVEKSAAKMIATDGHRLAFAEEKVSADVNLDVLIPKKALLELVKISKDAAGEVSFSDDPNHIYFEVGGRLLISRKLSGSFPNYEMVIPRTTDKIARFDGEELRDAIRRVALMSDERTQSIKLYFKHKEIIVSSQSSEEGDANEFIATDYDGIETLMGFNWRYVQDFLNSAVADGGEAQAAAEDSATEKESEGMGIVSNGATEKAKKKMCYLSFSDGNAQVVFRPENDAFLNVIMPLRV